MASRYKRNAGFQRILDGTGYDTTRDAIKVIHDVESPFGEFLVVNRTPIIELNSSYGSSALRDVETLAGTGSISSSDGEIVLSTGTTSSSSALIESAEIGRYIPGYSAELGVGFRLDTLPTNNEVATWGGQGEDADNGIYFGYDSGGLYVARKKSGTETDKIYQSSWNRDKLDGTGDSGYNLDITEGHIYQIDFTWYGYGQITYGVVGSVNNVQRFIPCHTLSGFTATSLVTPNLRVFAKVDNGGDSTDLTAYVGGRQYSILGVYRPKYRLTGETNFGVSVGTTLTPLISFQRKTGFGDRSIKIEGVSFGVASADIRYVICLDGTLTGASFGTPSNYTAAETAVESDTSATAISGGVAIYQDIALQGQANKNAFTRSDFDVDIPNGQSVTLCAQTDSGTATVTTSFRLREEW